MLKQDEDGEQVLGQNFAVDSVMANTPTEPCTRGGARDAIRRRKPHMSQRDRPKSSAEMIGYSQNFRRINNENLLVSNSKSCIVRLWTNSHVCDWLERTSGLEGFEDISVQMRNLGVTGRHLSDPEAARKILESLCFTDPNKKRVFLQKLLERLREDESPERSTTSLVGENDMTCGRYHKRSKSLKSKLIGMKSSSPSSSTKVANKITLQKFCDRNGTCDNEEDPKYKDGFSDEVLFSCTSMNIAPALSQSVDSLVTSSSDYVSGSSSTTSAPTSLDNSVAENGRQMLPGKKSLSNDGDISQPSTITSQSIDGSSSAVSRMRKKFAQLRGKVTNGGGKRTNNPNVMVVNKNGSDRLFPGLQPVTIFSDLLTPGEYSSFELHVTPTTSTMEVIQMFLDCQGIIDDVNLYSLHSVSRSDNSKDGNVITNTRQLSENECPYVVIQNATRLNVSSIHSMLEISKKRGISIQVVCRIGSDRPWNKVITVSPDSGHEDVLRLTLKKFGLRSVDHNLFTICEVKENDELYELSENMKVIWRTGINYVIADKASRQQTFTGVIRDTISISSASSISLKRTPSLNSDRKSTISDSDTNRTPSIAESWSSGSRSPGIESRVNKNRRMVYNCNRLSEVVDDVTTFEVDDDGEIEKDHSLLSAFTRSVSSDESNQARRFSKSSTSLVKTHVPLDNQSIYDCTDNGNLVVHNAVLKAQMHEQEERTIQMYRKIAEVRRILESGLQRQKDDYIGYYQKIDEKLCGTSSPSGMEVEMRSLEQEIENTESLLSQLFRHQRKLLSKCGTTNIHVQDGISAIHNAREIIASNNSNIDIDALADIEMKIALHQANLLSLKHHHQYFDIRMSLLVSQRKAERFRQMCEGSLYEILSQTKKTTVSPTSTNTQPMVQNQKPNGNPQYLIYQCGIHSGKAGYGLSLMQERIQGINSGIMVDTPHVQGRLRKGDRLIEVNGVNVQSTTTDFVARLLKGTKRAHIVVLRKIQSEPSTDKGEEGMSSQVDGCIVAQNNKMESDNETKLHMKFDKDSPSEETIIPHYQNHQSSLNIGSAESADLREFSALQSDLSIVMRELKVSEDTKRNLEAELERKKFREAILESQNRELSKKMSELKWKESRADT